MTKLIFVFIFSHTLLFSVDSQHWLQDWQNSALSELGYGNAYLLSREPSLALEHFHKASSYLDPLDDSSVPINFFIFFSEAIAYDCLGLQEQTKQSAGALLFIMNKFGKEDAYSYGRPTYREDGDPRSAILFLYNLVDVAHSSDLKNILLCLVDDIEEELFSDFGFANERSLEAARFDDRRDHFSIELCRGKSFWKKFKNWCKEAGDWMYDMLRIFNAANRIKEAYEQWKQENSQSNMSFDEFRRRVESHNRPLH